MLCVGFLPWFARARSKPIARHITSLGLRCPELNPIVQGKQLGLGHAEVNATNTGPHPQLVDLPVLETETSAHVQRARPYKSKPMLVRFYIDPARTRALSHWSSEHQGRRGMVRVDGHIASTQKPPIDAAFDLTASMLAGTYNGAVPLKRVCQARR